ncbi:MAG: NUDIX hydrolase [Candidatus Aenigmarchaeota archaeon]|nr:NUDIX hydrolase [Candidatus Aenigmarchaeota archaeon]
MKIRKSVGAFVVNKNGEFLLLKTQGEGEIYWDIMKGGVERGEKHIDALKRELKEELGTDKFDKIKKLNLKFSFEFSDEVKVKLGYRRQNVELFLVHFFGKNDDIKVDTTEILGFEFFNKENFTKNVTYDSTRTAFKKLKF